MGLAGTCTQVSLAVALHHKEGVCGHLGWVCVSPSIPGPYPCQQRSACRWIRVRICCPFCRGRVKPHAPDAQLLGLKPGAAFSFLLLQQKCKMQRVAGKLQMINWGTATARNQLLSYCLKLGTEERAISAAPKNKLWRIRELGLI